MMTLLSHWAVFLLGFVVGTVWTGVFAPRLREQGKNLRTPYQASEAGR